MKALLSIKPEFVDEIIKGTKRYEFRKKIFKRDVTDIVVYATKPRGKIIGEFSIKQILKDSPDNIWNETANYSGTSESFFNEYFKDCETAYAIEIDKLNIYKSSMSLTEYNENIKVAPQSFMYVN